MWALCGTDVAAPNQLIHSIKRWVDKNACSGARGRGSIGTRPAALSAGPIADKAPTHPKGSTMSRLRRSYESGHKPKFMVVIDDTPECDRAVYFASRRAARTGAKLIMLHVIDIKDSNQQWLGVADLMRAEATEAANAQLDSYAVRANNVAGIDTERVIREGEIAEQILELIEEDDDIALLILGAGSGKEGPGPLVANIGKTGGTFPIPVAIVPGQLTDEELEAVT